jgi:hypothetical protein
VVKLRDGGWGAGRKSIKAGSFPDCRETAIKSQLHCLCFHTLHLILAQKMAASASKTTALNPLPDYPSDLLTFEPSLPTSPASDFGSNDYPSSSTQSNPSLTYTQAGESAAQTPNLLRPPPTSLPPSSPPPSQRRLFKNIPKWADKDRLERANQNLPTS